MPPDDELARRLAHVLWLGGSPCAGKTSIADHLARLYGLRVYHFDRMERDHIARQLPGGNPKLVEFLSQTMDQRWLLPEVTAMTQRAIEAWTERFALVIEDLLAMPADGLILVEGPGLFPEPVSQLMAHPHQAIWLVSTNQFCAAVRQKRNGAWRQTSDPERALQKLIDRDASLARYVRSQAEALRLPVYSVDGSQSLDEVAAVVEQHFAPLLPKKQSIDS